MSRTLSEAREIWEKDLKLMVEVLIFADATKNGPDELDKLIVISQDKNRMFHINRYVPLMMPDGSTDFQASADLQRGTAAEVFRTIHCLFPAGIKCNLEGLYEL